MLICENAEGVHRQTMVGNPWPGRRACVNWRRREIVVKCGCMVMPMPKSIGIAPTPFVFELSLQQ